MSSKNKDNLSWENLEKNTIAGATAETVSRYGSAGAEFLKGLRGIDYETGQKFDRSLLDISEYAGNNIKQQAGFSAEIDSVSRKNAEAIIEGKANRFSRSEDISSYGKNHNVVDIVELLDGKEISTSQMKFVTDTDKLLKRIACGEGGGKNDYSRYMGVDKLEVPTEQVEKMKETCRQEAKKLTEQAKKLRQKGDLERAAKLEDQAKNYSQLEGKIADSGLTTDEAIALRLNPTWETAKNIAAISHRAGIEGAKFGAAIGGGISLISNIVSVYSGDKEFSDALTDVSLDTLKATSVGYATGFAGSTIKSLMQQSQHTALRSLSKTGLPAMIISACISTGKSVNKFINDEISQSELMQEMGLTVSSMLSASMFTVLGQMAIPIPVLGGLIGGMVGSALAGTFYQGYFAALQDAKLSAKRRLMLEIQCEASIRLARNYQQRLNQLFTTKLIQLNEESKSLFSILNDSNISADDYCDGINRFAEVLGKQLTIRNMAELDSAMLSDKPLII